METISEVACARCEFTFTRVLVATAYGEVGRFGLGRGDRGGRRFDHDGLAPDGDHFELGGLTWVSQSHGVHAFEVGALASFELDVAQCLYFAPDGARVAA